MTTDDQGGEVRRVLDENRRLRAEIDHLCADNEQLRGRLSPLGAFIHTPRWPCHPHHGDFGHLRLGSIVVRTCASPLGCIYS